MRISCVVPDSYACADRRRKTPTYSPNHTVKPSSPIDEFELGSKHPLLVIIDSLITNDLSLGLERVEKKNHALYEHGKAGQHRGSGANPDNGRVNQNVWNRSRQPDDGKPKARRTEKPASRFKA